MLVPVDLGSRVEANAEDEGASEDGADAVMDRKGGLVSPAQSAHAKYILDRVTLHENVVERVCNRHGDRGCKCAEPPSDKSRASPASADWLRHVTTCRRCL